MLQNNLKASLLGERLGFIRLPSFLASEASSDIVYTQGHLSGKPMGRTD